MALVAAELGNVVFRFVERVKNDANAYHLISRAQWLLYNLVKERIDSKRYEDVSTYSDAVLEEFRNDRLALYEKSECWGEDDAGDSAETWIPKMRRLYQTHYPQNERAGCYNFLFDTLIRGTEDNVEVEANEMCRIVSFPRNTSRRVLFRSVAFLKICEALVP